MGVGVGRGEDAVGDAAPRSYPLVVGPEPVQLVGLLTAGAESPLAGLGVLAAAVGGEEPCPLRLGDRLAGEPLHPRGEALGDLVHDAERVADWANLARLLAEWRTLTRVSAL